jgi:hypothetical protein
MVLLTEARSDEKQLQAKYTLPKEFQLSLE